MPGRLINGSRHSTAMPASLRTPVLQVDANVIHQVDTRNHDNLFSMWTVFARCAESVDQGRRLENLSWRLWTRETFCCEGVDQTTTPSTISLPKEIMKPRGSSTADDIPQLSGSVDSVADEEAVEFTSESAPMEILRPRIRRQDSCASSRSRGKERHITSDDLEKMVVSIVHAKEPLNAPLPEITPASPPTLPDKVASSPQQLERSGSTTTESLCKSSDTPSVESLRQAPSPEMASFQKHTMVVRGFSPSQIPVTSSVTSQSADSPSPSVIPEPKETPAPKIVQPKKQQPVFALGGSSGEDSYSGPSNCLETLAKPIAPTKMFEVGASSGEDSSLKSALHSSRPNSLINAQKKTASFNNQVVTRTYPTSAIADDEQSETDYVDESAIDDDDDSSDWEDSLEDSGKSSMDDKVTFKRDNSKANLTSRRSLITLMLAQNDRAQNLGNVASQSTSAIPRTRASRHAHSLMASPSDSDESPLEMKRTLRPAPMRSINEVPRSAAQPIVTTNYGAHQAALSPRTTRRNMLATELTESLRRHLLWERSQKTSTVNAVLKRRHTSQDVANLKQYPDRPYLKKEDDEVNASSWDEYLNKEAFTGYHSQGW